jgi:hypothetical protein
MYQGKEENIKFAVAQDFFGNFNVGVLDRIDFVVKTKQGLFRTCMWAESKISGNTPEEMFTQLLLTIKEPYTNGKNLPPQYLGAFDKDKIYFVEFNSVLDIFNENDVNWTLKNAADHKHENFLKLLAKVEKLLIGKITSFDFKKDEELLRQFIRSNFIGLRSNVKIPIDKNNYIWIYQRWLEEVKPTINVKWDIAKKQGIYEHDFYLADLLSKDDETLIDNLFVVLHKTQYEVDRSIDEAGFSSSKTVSFTDDQKAYNEFWGKYKRPPNDEVMKDATFRRDLLVPQTIRETRGAFFTPKIWCDLSKKYIGDVFGEDWQDEYYIWDCAAGTGNLLAGLKNYDRVFASTLEKSDVIDIQNMGGILKDNVFQFDFLNDSFDKLPAQLKKIIDDPKKRSKLIMYINPPYAESGSHSKLGGGKKGVQNTKKHDEFSKVLGSANRELFCQFLARIYNEFSGCKIAEFSKLKILQAPNFEKMRLWFRPKLEKIFIVPAETFDNVKGVFPIGFKIWDTSKNEKLSQIFANVYTKKGEQLENHLLYNSDNKKSISNWIVEQRKRNSNQDDLGTLTFIGSDFQQQAYTEIANFYKPGGKTRVPINKDTFQNISIFYSVRWNIDASWLNDRDQFESPIEKPGFQLGQKKYLYEDDEDFINNCLTFAIFNNHIESKKGTNHWIPFTASELKARGSFDSDFMVNFIKGKKWTPEATAVFNAGRELWKYYHSKIYNDQSALLNASLYEINEYFKGRNAKGKMNNKSSDAIFMDLRHNLDKAIKGLKLAIQPKVYEYGFLRG